MEHKCQAPDCLRLDAEDDPMFGWLCWIHMSEAYEEMHADTARMMQKEDDIR